MPRIRTIKPEFWEDEGLASCSAHARLLAIGLLQLCDANGVFRYVPMQIHAHVFPWEAWVNTPALLGELEGAGYVFFYLHDGRQYGCIPGFKKHQRLSGKEAKSSGIFPVYNQLVDELVRAGEAIGNGPLLPREAVEKAGTGNREQGTGKVLTRFHSIRRNPNSHSHRKNQKPKPKKNGELSLTQPTRNPS